MILLKSNSNFFIPAILSLFILTGILALKPSSENFPPHKQNFNPYQEKIPGSEQNIDLVPISGGSFTMGSSPQDPHHQPDEGPEVKVKVDSFWMGKYEITWDQFNLFVYEELLKDPAASNGSNPWGITVDGVSRPTPPYFDMTFGMGKEGYPAINMTQHAAQTFCKWLTAKTGTFYRLPTEAEWEYACRAGTKTAYHFGDDPEKLDEYAWYFDNSPDGYAKVGTKKPNPWGLYDMHGNVAEWTSDQYIPDFYQHLASREVIKNPWARPSELYPRTVRGGSWYHDANQLRSAARIASKAQWKQKDPQIPKSNWWHTNAKFVGFRIVRPVNQPSEEEINDYFTQPIPDM